MPTTRSATVLATCPGSVSGGMLVMARWRRGRPGGRRGRGAGCYRVFTETASGAQSDRPTLEPVLDQLRPGDTLVVGKLDRLGRSLRHMVDTVTGLAEHGIGFRSLREQIDTITPGGKLVFHVFAALAEFSRDLIRERTSARLAAARARGCHGGRPSVLTAHKLQVAR
jgi:DNA invertase Pin-like site-specific DNA recombinase